MELYYSVLYRQEKGSQPGTVAIRSADKMGKWSKSLKEAIEDMKPFYNIFALNYKIR